MLRTATIRRTNETLTVTHEAYGKLRTTLGEEEFANWLDHLNEVAQAAIASEFGRMVKELATLETARYYEPVRAGQTVVHDGTTVIVRVELTGNNKMSFGSRHDLVSLALGDMVAHVVRHLEPDTTHDEESSFGDLGAALASILFGGKVGEPFGGKSFQLFGDGAGDNLFGSPFPTPARNGSSPHAPAWGGLG